MPIIPRGITRIINIIGVTPYIKVLHLFVSFIYKVLHFAYVFIYSPNGNYKYNPLNSKGVNTDMLTKLKNLYQSLRSGNMAGLTVSAKQIVYFGIIMIVGVSIFDAMSFSANSYAANVTNGLLSALYSFVGTWLPIIVIVIAAAVLLNYMGAFK